MDVQKYFLRSYYYYEYSSYAMHTVVVYYSYIIIIIIYIYIYIYIYYCLCRQFVCCTRAAEKWCKNREVLPALRRTIIFTASQCA